MFIVTPGISLNRRSLNRDSTVLGCSFSDTAIAFSALESLISAMKENRFLKL